MMREIHLLIGLAIAAIVPLLLRCVSAAAEPPGPAARLHALALRLHPPAAVLALAALALPGGPLAAALALPWLGLCALLALLGLVRLRARRGVLPVEEAAIDAGLLYLPVGAAWLVASRAGTAPLGFGEPVAILTAAHFHYAGFAAPLLAGLAGRALRTAGDGAALSGLPPSVGDGLRPPGGSAAAPRPSARTAPACSTPGDSRVLRVYAPAAAAIVAGMPLVAAGITASPTLEVAGVAVFALGLAALAILLLTRVAPRARRPLARGLLRASGASLLLGMGLAATYGAAEYAGEVWIAVPTMVRTHAVLQALGFAGLGALGFAVESAAGPTPART